MSQTSDSNSGQRSSNPEEINKADILIEERKYPLISGIER